MESKQSEIKLQTFIYPGCISCCNGNAKYVNGYLPEYAKIYCDRTIIWRKKRIPSYIKEQIESISQEEFISVSASQNSNFYICPPNQ